MKTPAKSKNKSKSKNTKDGEYKNIQDNIIYINSNSAEISIGYDASKQTRYIQINNLD